MESEKTIYVSTRGRDSWSGGLPEPNRDKTDGPLATIAAARDSVRKQRRGLKGKPVRVMIGGGIYRLDEPLVFRPEDSGSSADSPITYSSVPGKKATVSGGRKIAGWKEVNTGGKRVWVTQAERWIKPGTRELFVNGSRRFRPRIPEGGFYEIEDPGVGIDAGIDEGVPVSTPQDSFGFAAGDIKKWKNLNDVEVVALHYWAESRLRIKSVDARKRIVRFASSTKRIFKERSKPTRYYVENVFEEMRRGQWYLDRKAGKLYYMPLEGEKINDSVIEAPVLDYLVRLEGEPASGSYVRHLHLKNIRFNHASAGFDEISCSRQAAVEVHGAIRLEGAVNCSVSGCEVSLVGTYGVELAAGCTGNQLTCNDIFDTGAGGVKINGAHSPLDTPRLTGNNVISGNHIRDGGVISHCAVGILSAHSGGNTIRGNHIHDFYYTGISVGWVWGYFKGNVSTSNLVEDNYIHHIGRGWLSDMGGIYTLGSSKDTVLRGNLIHDVKCYEYGGWGIYFDEGTSYILAEGNVVYNCSGAFNQHYGRDNILRNNVFGPCLQYQIRRLRAEDHLSFLFECNIVCVGRGKLLGGNFSKPGYIFNRNVYWRPENRNIRFLDMSFDKWRKTGQDAESVEADPVFLNPKKGDFTLKPDSPAFALGFKPVHRPETIPGTEEGPGGPKSRQ